MAIVHRLASEPRISFPFLFSFSYFLSDLLGGSGTGFEIGWLTGLYIFGWKGRSSRWFISTQCFPVSFFLFRLSFCVIVWLARPLLWRLCEIKGWADWGYSTLAAYRYIA